MSTNFAVSAEDLGKSYMIRYQSGGSYVTMRDVIAARAKRAVSGAVPLGRRSSPPTTAREEFWALRDLTFTIQPGDRVGIIGRNGAGKSTLLKVISRITAPTTGHVRIRGRVASLLEVGTGFHDELTGRENIFLNGAILGMSRAEIRARFDEIVAFSEVERFLDTPVKRYSSGMRVRLAFAVAAHLEPEVLIVDEVLAVGDASFQKKCINKMQDVGQEGRTVLFVSHNINTITRLCDRAILLADGQLVADGPAHTVAARYSQSGLGTLAAREWPDPARAPGNGVARLRAVRVRNEQGDVGEAIDIRRPVGIELEFDVETPGYILAPNFHLVNEDGTVLFVSHDLDPAWRRRPRPAGRYVATGWIPGNLLAEGTFFIRAAMTTFEPFTVHFDAPDAVSFHVVDTLDGDSTRGDYGGSWPGLVRPALEWTNRMISGEESELLSVPSPETRPVTLLVKDR